MPFQAGDEVHVDIVEPHMYNADDGLAKVDGYTAAGCGTSSRTRSSTRTGSAGISAGCSEAYTEVAKRLGIMGENERPQGTGPILVKG